MRFEDEGGEGAQRLRGFDEDCSGRQAPGFRASGHFQHFEGVLLKGLLGLFDLVNPVDLQIKLDGFAQFLDRDAVTLQGFHRLRITGGKQVGIRPRDGEDRFNAIEKLNFVILGLIGGDVLAVFFFFNPTQGREGFVPHDGFRAERNLVGRLGIGFQLAYFVLVLGRVFEEPKGERTTGKHAVLEGSIGIGLGEDGDAMTHGHVLQSETRLRPISQPFLVIGGEVAIEERLVSGTEFQTFADVGQELVAHGFDQRGIGGGMPRAVIRQRVAVIRTVGRVHIDH